MTQKRQKMSRTGHLAAVCKRKNACGSATGVFSLMKKAAQALDMFGSQSTSCGKEVSSATTATMMSTKGIIPA